MNVHKCTYGAPPLRGLLLKEYSDTKRTIAVQQYVAQSVQAAHGEREHPSAL